MRRWGHWTEPRFGVGILLAGILLLGVGVRLLYWLDQPMPARDEISYIWVAQALRDGDGLKAAVEITLGDERYPPPLLMVMLAGGEWLGLEIAVAGRIFSLSMGCLMLVFAFFIGRRVWADSRIGLWGAFLLAVNPYSVEMSCRILRDQPFWTCCMAVLLLLLYAKNGFGWMMLGVLCTLSMLFRREGILLPVICLLIWGANFRADFLIRRGAWRPAVGNLALLGAGFAVSAGAVYMVLHHYCRYPWPC